MLVDLDGASGYEQYFELNFFEDDERQSRDTFQDRICFKGHGGLRLSKPVSIACNPTAIERSVNSLFLTKIANAKANESGGSVTLDLSVDWGGSQGTTFSGSINAEAHDDRGNTVEVRVEQSSDGSGSATVSGSHETKQ